MDEVLLVGVVVLASCSPAVGSEGEASSGAEAVSSTSTGVPSSDISTSLDATGGADASTESGAGSTSGPGVASSSSDTDASTSGADLMPVPGECDVWLQDCPAGEKCGAYATQGSVWDAVGCFPVVPSPDLPGETCQVLESAASGFDTCELGSMCWGPYEDDVGECVALCTGSSAAPSCDDPGRVCSISNEGVLNLCLQTCDPESVDPCPPGEACYPIDENHVCAPDPDPKTGPETCDDSNCSPGTICVTAEAYGPDCESAGCCTDVCSVSAPECENPDQECVPWFPKDPPPGSEDVGACMVPI